MSSSVWKLPTGNRPQSLGALLAVGAFLCVAGAIAYRAVDETRVSGNPSFPVWALCDFRAVVYYPALSFLAGGNPYDAAAFKRAYPVPVAFPLYSPLVILLHLPFALLPVTVSAVAYFATVLCFTLVIALMTLRFVECEVTVAGVFSIGTLLLLTRPGQANLTLGQVATTATLACYGALWWSGSRPWLSAIALTIATFKPTFGGPLILLMVARGDWRSVRLGLIIAAIVTAAPAIILIHRAGGPLAMMNLALSLQRSWSAVPENATSASISRLDAGALVGRLLGRPLTPSIQALISLAALAAAALALRRLMAPTAEMRRYSTALICVTILVSCYHQAYDALLLTLPVTALAVDRWVPISSSTSTTRLLLLTALLTPGLNYLDTDTMLARLSLTRGWWLAVTSANGAALLAAFIVYLSLTFLRMPSRTI